MAVCFQPSHIVGTVLGAGASWWGIQTQTVGDSHSQRAGRHTQGPDVLGESTGACEKEESGPGWQASEILGASKLAPRA